MTYWAQRAKRHRAARRFEDLVGLGMALSVSGADDGERHGKEQVKAAVRKLRESWKTLLETLMREAGGRPE